MSGGGRMKDKKQVIIDAMQSEFDHALKFPVEKVKENYSLTIQSVYQKLKDSFVETFIPEHILDVLLEDVYPLNKYYDYFFNEGDLRIGVEWNKLCKAYALYREYVVVDEKLHDKIQEEYKLFMTRVVDMTPYKMGKIVTEIAIKMQVFSIFRYQDLFSMDDLKVLQNVDNLLDKIYEKHDGALIPIEDEHLLWAKTYDYLERVVEDAKGLEIVDEDALEA